MSDTNPAAAPDQPDVEAEFEDLSTTPTTDADNHPDDSTEEATA